MHSSSSGYQISEPTVRVIKKEVLASLDIKRFNEQENAAFHGRSSDEAGCAVMDDDEDGITGHATQSTLKLARLLYCPPFLKRDEIRQRRFGGQPDMNDRWWEWEKEKGIQTREREDRFKWAS